MIALLQRVAQAGVTVDGETMGEVGRGLCVLVCAVKGDTEEKARAWRKKCCATAYLKTMPAR